MGGKASGRVQGDRNAGEGYDKFHRGEREMRKRGKSGEKSDKEGGGRQ